MNFSLTDTQKLQCESIIEFAKRELNGEVRENDMQGNFPSANWKKCADMGLLSLLTPQEHEGLGEDLVSAVLAIEALSYGCEDGGLVHAIVTQLCCITLLTRYGSESQKKSFLPKLSRGELIAAQALTEPDAGSDLLAMQTRVVFNDDSFSLSGGKVFISNGPLADLVIVFAKCDEKKSVFGSLSCFLIEKSADGYCAGKPLEKMGLRTLQNCELFFDEVSVPADMMLGKSGHGMFIFNEGIEWERALMIAAHLGTLKRVLEKSVDYAKTRKQFGQEIGKNQSVANKISDMKVNLELGKMILYKTAWLKDQGKSAMMESSIGKLFVSESLKKACLDAVQIHGGYGYMREYDVERDLRDSIASTIYSGTSEIQLNIISKILGL